MSLGSLRDFFGITLGWVWGHFGMGFGVLWDVFAVTLGWLWGLKNSLLPIYHCSRSSSSKYATCCYSYHQSRKGLATLACVWGEKYTKMSILDKIGEPPSNILSWRLRQLHPLSLIPNGTQRFAQRCQKAHSPFKLRQQVEDTVSILSLKNYFLPAFFLRTHV